MRLSPDVPVGRPSFELSADQMATVVDLTCRGVSEARAHVRPGMLEVPITKLVRKEMRRVKKRLHLTNLQIRGEHELDDMSSNDPNVLGRIDITLQFAHQFGDEDAYVGVECKRIGVGESDLNRGYVTDGVHRFATGQYATGHPWGVMLAYVLATPADDVIKVIDAQIRKTYGEAAKLAAIAVHEMALGMYSGVLSQGSNHQIQLWHILMDVTVAARPARA